MANKALEELLNLGEEGLRKMALDMVNKEPFPEDGTGEEKSKWLAYRLIEAGHLILSALDDKGIKLNVGEILTAEVFVLASTTFTSTEEEGFPARLDLTKFVSRLYLDTIVRMTVADLMGKGKPNE